MSQYCDQMNAINLKNSIPVLLVALLFSCSKKNLSSQQEITRGDEYRGQKIKAIPKVAIVDSIYKVADTAIDQSWSKQTWVIRFGQPSRVEAPNDDVQIIEYRDHGPYQPPIARYFLSGAYIKLVNDKTVSVTYAHTTLE